MSHVECRMDNAYSAWRCVPVLVGPQKEAVSKGLPRVISSVCEKSILLIISRIDFSLRSK